MAHFTGLKELQNRPHKSGHDISAKNCFTAKVGELLPVWTDFAIPNSTYRFNLEYFTRTRPVQTSAYTRIREYFDFFAVPCDLIWKSFDSAVIQMGEKLLCSLRIFLRILLLKVIYLIVRLKIFTMLVIMLVETLILVPNLL